MSEIKSIYPKEYLLKNGLLRYYTAPGRYGFAIYEVGYQLPLLPPLEYCTENSAKLDCIRFNALGPEEIWKEYWIRYVISKRPLGAKIETFAEWKSKNANMYEREDRR